MCSNILTYILLKINCKRIGAHTILRINKTGKQSESCMDFISSMWNHNGYICLGWCSRTFSCIYLLHYCISSRGRRPCRDRIGVGVKTTCAISVYHHWSCDFVPRSWRGVPDTTICDTMSQWLATGEWFSPRTPVSPANKTDCHDIAEILLKVMLKTINHSIFSLN